MMASRFLPTKTLDQGKLIARLRADLDFFESVVKASEIGHWRVYEEFVRWRMATTHFQLHADFGQELQEHLAFIQAEERSGRGEAWAKPKGALLRLLELWQLSCGPRPVVG